MTLDLNEKIDTMYSDLNGKFEILNTRVKKLDTRLAQTAGLVMWKEGTLPGRTDADRSSTKIQCIKDFILNIL